MERQLCGITLAFKIIRNDLPTESARNDFELEFASRTWGGSDIETWLLAEGDRRGLDVSTEGAVQVAPVVVR